jgi:hypothetical protein
MSLGQQTPNAQVGKKILLRSLLLCAEYLYLAVLVVHQESSH